MGRFTLLSVIVYGLVIAGLASLNGGLLALAIPFTLYLGMGLLFRPPKMRLKAYRTISRNRVAEGSSVVVTLIVSNEGERLEEALIEEQVPKPLPVLGGDTSLRLCMAPGDTARLEYVLGGRRGVYTFEQIKVTANDGLDLTRRVEGIAAEGATKLVVLPDVLRLRRIPIRPRQTRVYAGFIPTRLGGPGVEFHGVRNYQIGDALRHINWKASARHPQSHFTNEYEQERVADVGLILDARARVNLLTARNSLLDCGIQAVAALGETFLHAGNRVGLLIYGHTFDWTFPGYGKVQRERLIQALARAKIGDSLVFDKLENVPTRLFPPKSQLVLVSPLSEDDLPFLIRLRARGYHLLVISPNPISFEAEDLNIDLAVDLAVRLARVERRFLIRKLLEAGIYTLDWDVRAPFDQVIHAWLMQLPLWYRQAGFLT